MGKRTQKKGGAPLGKALIKNKKDAVREIQSSSGRFVSATDGGDAASNLTSYLEGSSMDDFLTNAVLSGRQFAAEKERIVVLQTNDLAPILAPSSTKDLPTMDFTSLKVPRRPMWDSTTTPQELNAREKESFLDWRRDLAVMEEATEDKTVTPFEKNLEVWRQLWRVIERSDIVVQILDSRNPLFYRSPDLENYVHESPGNKRTLLVINKADFLTDEQRELWAKYFEGIGVKFVFFSAKLAQEELDEMAREERSKLDEMDDEDLNGENDDEEEEKEEEKEERESESGQEVKEEESDKLDGVDVVENTPLDPYRVLTREELLAYFETMAHEVFAEVGARKDDNGRIKLGMVGYPNVGKSSVINALLGASVHSHTKSRVAVGATPGKTKHFQTMILSEMILLCDCPGLVFPSFVNSKGEMICCGVLPLSQLRDHMPPTNLVCQRIPRISFERTYGIKLSPLQSEGLDIVDPYHLLEAYALNRSFMASGKSGADTSRAARVILRDYVNGKILYCHSPPGLSEEDAKAFDPFLLALKSLAEDGARGEQILNNLKELQLDDRSELSNMSMKTIAKEEENIGRLKDEKSKRLKKHGRKGRKGREKNPYEDASIFNSSSVMVHTAGGKKKQGGRNFTRIVHPHHPSYDPTTTVNR